MSPSRDLPSGGGAEAPRRSASRSPSRSERRLAARLARGDESALREIEVEYSRMLRGYLQQLLRDRSAAEDVLQQVMLEVWQRRASFEPARGSMASWVMLIARSRAIDQMRRQVPEPLDPAIAASVADSRDPEEHPADELAEQWRMAHLLAQLPREESEILRMRFHRQMSQSEIAADTGIALGTVKMRMVSGLTRLRELMDEEG